VLALADMLHEGHAVPAGLRDPLQLDPHDRAHRLRRPERGFGEGAEQPGVTGVVGEDDVPAAVQAQDPRRPREGAQHHDDPAVLAQVGHGLRPRPAEVHVGHRVGPEHP